MGRLFTLILFVFLMVSCTKVINQGVSGYSKGELYGVLPFENYTETPYAGYRVASILEGVLGSKGYRLVQRTGEAKEGDYTKEELEKIKGDCSIYSTML